jgi:hypothetical protein
VRVAARIGAALLVLLLVAIVGTGWAVTRLIGAGGIQARLSEIAVSELGREIGFSDFEVALFPPSVSAINAVIGDASAPLARAERVDLIPILAPFLAGIFAIDSVSVEGFEIDLVRASNKISFADSVGEASVSTKHSDQTDRSDWVVRDLSFSNAMISLEDRTVTPPLVWVLREIDARARTEVIRGEVRLDLSGKFASGGQIAGGGTLGFGGGLDFDFEFESVAIAPAKPYFRSDAEVGGLMAGTIRLRESIEDPKLELSGTLREARIQLGEIALRGSFGLEATIESFASAPRGVVSIDATRAELRYANFFTKPPGTPAQVVGELSLQPDGSIAIEAWKFVMQDLDGQAQAGPGTRTRIAETAPLIGPNPLRGKLRSR